MKKFEYKIVKKGLYNQISLDELTTLGRDGWELSTIEQVGVNTGYIFIREISDIDYGGLLIKCAFMKNVPWLQHRTIAEFAMFVEDVMSNKLGCEKYSFDFNSTDAIRTWIEKFHEYCKEYYSNIEKRITENEMETLRKIHEGEL